MTKVILLFPPPFYLEVFAKTKRSGKVALVPSARCCLALTQGWGKLVGSCAPWIAHCDVTKGAASSPSGGGDGPGQMLTPPF